MTTVTAKFKGKQRNLEMFLNCGISNFSSKFLGLNNLSVEWIIDEDNNEKENLLERFQTVKLLIEKRLTENQRKILELRDYQGLEIEDIANRLNMQPATIRMNLSRARKTIREQYKKLNAYDR